MYGSYMYDVKGKLEYCQDVFRCFNCGAKLVSTALFRYRLKDRIAITNVECKKCSNVTVVSWKSKNVKYEFESDKGVIAHC